MDADGGETPRKGRRWRRRMGWAALAAAGAAAALATGAPQRWAAVRGLEAALPGAQATAEGVGVAGGLRAKRLALGDPGEPPAVAIDDLAVAYNPFGARWFPSVRAGAVRLDFDGRDPANTSYDFILRLFAPKDVPSAGIPPMAIPESIAVDRLDVSYESGPMGASISGIPLRVALASLEAFEAAVSAYGVSGSYRMTDPPVDQAFTDGRLDIAATADGGAYRVDPMTVMLPGVIDWEGTAEAVREGPRLLFDVDLRRAEVNGLDFSEAATGLLPFRFARADFSGTHVRGAAERGVIVLGDSRIAGAVEGLYAGAADARLYEGDLRIDGSASDGKAAITAVLGQEQALRLDAAGGLDSGSGTVALSNWSRAQVAGALPYFAAPLLDYAPTLAVLSASAEIGWDDAAVSVKGLAEAGFDGAEARLAATIGAAIPRDGDSPVQVTADATLGSSGMTGEATIGRDGRIEGSADLAAFNVADAARILGLQQALQDIETVVTGHVDVTGAGPYAIAADVRAKPVPYIAYPLPDDESLGIAGTVSYDVAAGEARSSAMTLRFGSDATVAVSSLRVRPAPLHVAMKASAEGDLGAIAGRFDLGPLSGAAEAESTVQVRGDDATVTTEFTVDGLGYGTTGLPFDAPLRGSLETAYRIEAKTGSLSLKAVTGDGGTEAQWTEGAFALDPALTATGTLAVESDLIALRELGLVADAEGTAAVSGVAGYGPEGVALDGAAVDLEAFVIELLDKVARISGLAFEGTGGYGAGRSLSGRFGAARMEAAGAVLTEVYGTAEYGEEGVRLSLERGVLYDGRIHKGTIRLRTGESGTVIEGDVEFREVDLAVFTEEFKPPSTRLTGLLSGAVEFTFEGGALTSAAIRARAPEGFSVNKDLIREQLLKQTINDATLGILFGESDGEPADGQRAFDHATLEMRYVPGENMLAGEARMVSEELRLTMPMTVDMRVITEGLRFRQERHLEEVDDIRLVPVELGE